MSFRGARSVLSTILVAAGLIITAGCDGDDDLVGPGEPGPDRIRHTDGVTIVPLGGDGRLQIESSIESAGVVYDVIANITARRQSDGLRISDAAAAYSHVGDNIFLVVRDTTDGRAPAYFLATPGELAASFGSGSPLSGSTQVPLMLDFDVTLAAAPVGSSVQMRRATSRMSRYLRTASIAPNRDFTPYCSTYDGLGALLTQPDFPLSGSEHLVLVFLNQRNPSATDFSGSRSAVVLFDYDQGEDAAALDAFIFDNAQHRFGTGISASDIVDVHVYPRASLAGDVLGAVEIIREATLCRRLETQPVVLTIDTPTEAVAEDVSIQYGVSNLDDETTDILVTLSSPEIGTGNSLTLTSTSVGEIGTSGEEQTVIRGVTSGSHSFVWDSQADIPDRAMGGVRIGIEWLESDPTAPVTAETGPFVVANGNRPPRLVFSAIAQTQTDQVTVPFTVFDPEGDSNDFFVTYSSPAERNVPATLSSASAGMIELDPSGVPNTLRDVPVGEHTIVWESETDLPDATSNFVRIQIHWIAPDGSDPGLSWSIAGLTIDNRSFQRLTADDLANEAFFGASVALDQETIVVGAPADNGNGQAMGSAYVFERIDGAWGVSTRLSRGDLQPFDFFGRSVAVDRSTITVGASGDRTSGGTFGSVTVFERTAGSWIVSAVLDSDGSTSGDDFFGYSVDVEGDFLIAGSPGGRTPGSVRLFQRSGGSWTPLGSLIASDGRNEDFFGSDVAIEGSTIVVGAPAAGPPGNAPGATYVFELTDGEWVQTTILVPDNGRSGDFFGDAVALNSGTLVVGAPQHDNGGSDSGAAYVFEKTNGTWALQAVLLSDDSQPHDFFGSDVSVSGDLIAVTAPFDDDRGRDSGSIYLYQRMGSVWSLRDKRSAPSGRRGDLFGSAVAIQNNQLVVGAESDDVNEQNIGSVYLFDIDR